MATTMNMEHTKNLHTEQHTEEAGKATGQQRKQRRNQRLLFKVLMLVGILAAVSITFKAHNTSITYHITETEARIAVLQNEIENLNLELTSNMSPEIIEEKAIEELGMEYPSASQYVYIDAVTGDIQTAKAEEEDE